MVSKKISIKWDIRNLECRFTNWSDRLLSRWYDRALNSFALWVHLFWMYKWNKIEGSYHYCYDCVQLLLILECVRNKSNATFVDEESRVAFHGSCCTSCCRQDDDLSQNYRCYKSVLQVQVRCPPLARLLRRFVFSGHNSCVIKMTCRAGLAEGWLLLDSNSPGRYHRMPKCLTLEIQRPLPVCFL
jgi:hypothetical protein